jgi:hypothetical protein
MIKAEINISQRNSLYSAIKYTFSALNIFPVLVIGLFLRHGNTNILINTIRHGDFARTMFETFLFNLTDTSTNVGFIVIIVVSLLFLGFNIVSISVKNMISLLRVLITYKLKATIAADEAFLIISSKKLLDYRIWRGCLVALRRKPYAGLRGVDARKISVEFSQGEGELQHLIRPLG